GNLVASNPVDGCTAFSNAGAVNGNIAVVDRGDCQFGDKSLAAQNAGAVAVIICNNEAGGTIAMGPGNVGGQVTIPAVMISQGDCATIRAALGSGVNVTMTGTPGGVSKDGSMDNGIISHEYGHGVSIRLAGGPGNSGCLGNAEQAGEGWSDFFGLVLTQKPGDDKNTVRGIGTYATSEPTTGNGIRAYPYSYDMAVNPFTYADIAGQAVPHGVGSVFCTMIWDLYWDLIDAYGFDSDIYGGSGGNNIAMQLVIDGLKLQPCSPGFVDMRDAILAADEANYNGANRCLIWNTFARRGLGYSADQGSSASNTDQTEAFDLPPDVGNLDITKTSNVSTADEGATVDYTVQITNFCQDATNVQVTDILPAGLSYVAGSASGGGTEAGGIITWPLISNYPKGSATTYTYQAVINPGTYSNTPTTTISDDMESGAGNWTTTNVAGFSNWTLVNDGGSTRWFAEELEAQNLGGTIENQYLTLDAQNLNGNSTLSFLHRYDTEANWDGAKVEISTDGGNRWEDLGPYMTSNGYNDYINNNTADLAFSGNSGGYITTTADLSNFCGANALIRFNFYYDALEAGNGWYVDDVMLSTSTSVVSNIANVSSAAGNSSAFNCVTVTEDTPVIEVNGKTISLSLFPNPVTSTLNLDLESTESLGELTIEIYNTAGQKVRTQKVITANSQQLLPVNVSDFATGIYTVKVIGEAFNLSDKFVVTK
ncbi:MAG: M36 family metallopeptidase, partial [Saprospiraceae bacterium]